MRIISGRFKGIRLNGPKGSWIRPTTDRVKEFIFSYLSSRIQHYSSVLDLFAGTGSLGIEASSRGAHHIVFVEKSKQSVEVLEKNLEKVKIQAKIIHLDVFKFIDQTKSNFDLVFCDPPYNFGRSDELICMIDESNLINPNGWLVYEHGTQCALNSGEHLIIQESRKLGDTVVTFIQSEKTN